MLFDVFFQKYVEVLSGKKYNNGLFYVEFLEKEIEILSWKFTKKYIMVL